MAKVPTLPGMASGRKRKPNLPPALEPNAGSTGKPGAKAGKPNFKSRLVKPGGMACGGRVKMAGGGRVMAGQGSGIGRLQRSK
jgi:hypothetical protein